MREHEMHWHFKFRIGQQVATYDDCWLRSQRWHKCERSCLLALGELPMLPYLLVSKTVCAVDQVLANLVHVRLFKDSAQLKLGRGRCDGLLLGNV